MNAATAGLVGAAIGFGGNAVVTLITKHYEERKARREILVKTAWDYFSSHSDLAKNRDVTLIAVWVVHLLHGKPKSGNGGNRNGANDSASDYSHRSAMDLPGENPLIRKCLRVSERRDFRPLHSRF
jgi:hypothetical protein